MDVKLYNEIPLNVSFTLEYNTTIVANDLPDNNSESNLNYYLDIVYRMLSNTLLWIKQHVFNPIKDFLEFIYQGLLQINRGNDVPSP